LISALRGLKKEALFAVSTYMATEHDNCCDQKEWFIAGYDEDAAAHLSRKKSSVTITPFPEMSGQYHLRGLRA